MAASRAESGEEDEMWMGYTLRGSSWRIAGVEGPVLEMV